MFRKDFITAILLFMFVICSVDASEATLRVGPNMGDHVFTTSDLVLEWNYFNISDSANITIVSLENPTSIFPTISIQDRGYFLLSMGCFSSTDTVLLPGAYCIKLSNSFSLRTSNHFIISGPNDLLVRFGTEFIRADTPVTLQILWVPFNNVGVANITIWDVSLGNMTLLATDVPDNGRKNITINYPPSLYVIQVTNSYGTGSAPLTISNVGMLLATPNNISATNSLGTSNTVTQLRWLPHPSMLSCGLVMIDCRDELFYDLIIPNSGLYDLNATALNLQPALYYLDLRSYFGTGTINLTVHNEKGLSIISPTRDTIVYSNSVAFNVSWVPFYSCTSNAIITLLNLNTKSVYTFSVENNGTAVLDLMSLRVPASSYDIMVSTDLGNGIYHNFTILHPLFLEIIIPKKVADNETLSITWNPINPAGGKSSFYMYNETYEHGPFYRPDNGSTTFDFSQPNLALLDEFTRLLV